jgi:hypothetical protein
MLDDILWLAVLLVNYFCSQLMSLPYYLLIEKLLIEKLHVQLIVLLLTWNLFYLIDLRDDKQFFVDNPGVVPITTAQVEIISTNTVSYSLFVSFSLFLLIIALNYQLIL